MTEQGAAVPAIADGEVVTSGYEPELKRTLGGFQLFAISFAVISVAVGIFATYGVVLNTAGPVGIWLWVIAAIGQTLVALVVALFVLVTPADAVVPDLVVLGLILAGGIYFANMMIVNREVLSAEPAEAHTADAAAT